jgi:putative addiction module component (TIGR02574 family)
MTAMARDLNELIREAAQLPESDRATLAGAMIESLDPRPTAAVKAAWSREIERRLREIDDKSVELIDWEDIRAEFLAAD